MDFLALINNALGTDFHKPAYDPKVGRKKLVRQIDLAAKQHEAGTTKAPNRSWAVGSNKAISFEPKIDGHAVMIGGEPINYVPADRFQDFLAKLKEAVEAGRLDDEIKDALDGNTTSPAPVARRPRGSGSASKEGKYPKHLNPNYGGLTDQQKRNVGRWWSMGKNPDQSLRADVGDKPDAAYAEPSKA